MNGPFLAERVKLWKHGEAGANAREAPPFSTSCMEVVECSPDAGWRLIRSMRGKPRTTSATIADLNSVASRTSSAEGEGASLPTWGSGPGIQKDENPRLHTFAEARSLDLRGLLMHRDGAKRCKVDSEWFRRHVCG